MTIAQGYVYCGCLSAAIAMVGGWMIYMGVGRRGEASELDDAGARMLLVIGTALLLVVAAFWVYAFSYQVPGLPRFFSF
ncbi:MAG: hypothetical protein HYR71_05090 [Chloroflexi bacterium]|nr:hypothetical protein [Chloroflexota bacterium]